MRYVSMITAALLITVVGCLRKPPNWQCCPGKTQGHPINSRPVTCNVSSCSIRDFRKKECGNATPYSVTLITMASWTWLRCRGLGNGTGAFGGSAMDRAIGRSRQPGSCMSKPPVAEGWISPISTAMGILISLSPIIVKVSSFTSVMAITIGEMVEAGLFPHHLAPKGNEYATMYRGLEDAATGDLNNDGFIDVVAGASDKGGISVYFGNGTGRDWVIADTNLPTKGWANRVHIDDINNDGKADLVASYSEGPRAWLQIDGKDWKPVSRGLPSPTVNGLFTGLDVGDVNEDGLADIAIANWGGWARSVSSAKRWILGKER